MNSPNLDFEYALPRFLFFFSFFFFPSVVRSLLIVSMAESKAATVVINLTANDLLEETKPIALDTIKFGRVDTITV